MTEPWYPLSAPTIGDEEIDAVTEVLRSRKTTMGQKVEEFEAKFARHVGAQFAVMVNSGSSADLLLAYATKSARGYEWMPPEVLISAVTWPTHVWSFKMAGYGIKFVDVDGLNTTEKILEEAATPRTKAISLVHLMGIPVVVGGYPVDWAVTEDCCEALGSSPIGQNPSAWSFFFSHHMTTMEGGMITCRDRQLYEKLRSMRSHGWARGIARYAGSESRYTFINPGFNVRPLEIAAAVGLVQLTKLAAFNEKRAENRQAFVDALKGCPFVELPVAPEGTTPSWFGLPMFVEQRDSMRWYLESKGVETRPILGGNLLRQPAFADWPHQDLPGADRVHDHGLYVGLHPFSNSGVEDVADLIWRFQG